MHEDVIHGDGSRPRMFTDGTRYFKAMRLDVNSFIRLQDWIGSIGFESEIDQRGRLVIKEGNLDGTDMAVEVLGWVAMFPRLTAFTDEEFRALARPAVMCGYGGQ